MAAGSICSWSEYIHLRTVATGIPRKYEKLPVKQFAVQISDGQMGQVCDMFVYSADHGYNGSDKTLLRGGGHTKGGYIAADVR